MPLGVTTTQAPETMLSESRRMAAHGRPWLASLVISTGNFFDQNMMNDYVLINVNDQ